MALRFVEINHIIIKKKKKRWLKLVCWHFCYLADKRTDKYDYHQFVNSSQDLEDALIPASN
jgi:hypothetical protein